MSNQTISVYEFMKRFPDEGAARKYIEGHRWQDGAVCPYCKSDNATNLGAGQYYQCNNCRRKFTVRTGTIFERSHIPLDKWLYAMYLLTTARKGVSSVQVSKELGITQKSAWFMLHRIREACKDNPMELCGIVEVDETYVGGKEKNKHGNKKLRAGRGTTGKQPVMGMRERGGHTVARLVSSTNKATLQRMVIETVEPGATVYTDELPSYIGLNGQYCHASVCHGARQYVDGGVHTNGIESVWATLKRGHYGTYHHFSVKHMQRYVDECTFRLNDGSCHRHTMDRIASLCNGASGRRITYKALIS